MKTLEVVVFDKHVVPELKDGDCPSCLLYFDGFTAMGYYSSSEGGQWHYESGEIFDEEDYESLKGWSWTPEWKDVNEHI